MAAPVKGEYCVTVFFLKIQDGRRCRVPQQRTKAKAMSTVGGRGCKMATTAAFPRQTLPEGFSAQSRPCVVDGAAPSLLPFHCRLEGVEHRLIHIVGHR